jgi:putative oxidoreductase
MRRFKISKHKAKGFLQLDAALLLLRLGVSSCMMLLHGLPYLINFESEAGRFQPLFGFSARDTITVAVAAEVGGSIFVALGVFTRFAAFVLAMVMFIAFAYVHGASFSGEQSGELAFLYFVGFLTLVVAGGGRFSLKC